jgi:hypothetical protein
MTINSIKGVARKPRALKFDPSAPAKDEGRETTPAIRALARLLQVSVWQAAVIAERNGLPAEGAL